MSDVQTDWPSYLDRVELEINASNGATIRKNIALRMARFFVLSAVRNGPIKERVLSIIDEALKEW